MKKIAILGGGVSGLSCAHYLTKLSKSIGRSDRIILIEASNSVGGWLRSQQFEDGVVHELGPKSIRASGLPAFNTLLLAEELNLTSDIINVGQGDAAAKKRLICLNDKLFTLPNSLKSLIFRTPPFSKPLISSLFNDFKSPQLTLTEDGGKDISVHNFMVHRFGEEVAKFLFDPMCRGIAAGDSKKLSLKSMFPPIFQAEREKGSVIKGMFSPKVIPETIKSEISSSSLLNRVKSEKWSIWSLRNGLQQLPKQIYSNLVKDSSSANIEVHLGHQVDHIMFKDDGSAVLHISNSNSIKPISVDFIFSALPANNLAKCISPKAYPTLHEGLKSIRSVSVAVVNLEYSGTVIPRDMGFGFLTPSFTNSPILGIVFDSCCFKHHDANRDITRLTVMMGGEWFEDQFGDPVNVDHQLILKMAQESVRNHLQVNVYPSRTIVNVHKDCIPQYYVGHGSRVETIKKEIERHKLNLELIGNSFAGLGVNDSIYDARQKAHQFYNK